MSGYNLIVLSLVVFICKVQSQFCSPILPPPCPAPCVPSPCVPSPCVPSPCVPSPCVPSPCVPPPCVPPPCVPSPCLPPIPPYPITSQLVNPNPCVTTIIDTSVSDALVNTLQLLIVSNLIGASIGPSTPLVNNLGPLLDSLIVNQCPELAIPEYLSCGPSYDLIPPYYPITCNPYYDIIPPCVPCNPCYEVIPSCYPCNPYYDTIPPCYPCNPYYDTIPPCMPNNCNPCYDLIPPYYPIMDPYSYCGWTDFVSPNCITYTETYTPICIDTPYGYGDVFLPPCGFDCPTIYGLSDIIPNYINYPEICPLNPYRGFDEIIAPTVVTFPNVCYNDFSTLTPICNYAPEVYGLPTLVPNYYGAELAVPMAPEVLIPAPIPGPVSVPCNYGYSPTCLPSVRVNVDPYDNCYNGYGPIYY